MEQRKNSRKRLCRFVLKSAVVVICVTGFLLQTSEFMFLYLTYPTVVDIQVSVPAEIEVPGITFCNANGMSPEAVCRLSNRCSRGKMLMFVNYCKIYREFCIDDDTTPEGFEVPRYDRLTKNVALNESSLRELRVPWEDFLTCSISTGIGGATRECNTDSIVFASYYSEITVPSFCFSMNTRWGDPKRKMQMLKKSERINLQFYSDISYRNRSAPEDLIQLPRYLPSDAPTSVKIAIHSPDMTVSPYVFGKGFLGGKNYRIKLKKHESHLLPAPYQTNCTDYLKDWRTRGGEAPLNQFMVVQECRKNVSVEKLGCVPYDVDYPHNNTLCIYCPSCPNQTRSGENCTDVLSGFNQPCDYTEYEMNIEELWVYEIRSMKTVFMANEEVAMFRKKGHNCTGQNMFMKRCQIINIEVDFDEFQVTNVSYNPKFESLELFSVVGGYMGMYLGISLVAIYDFLETILKTTVTFLNRYHKNRKRKELQKINSVAILQGQRYPNGLRKRKTLSKGSFSVY